MDGILPTSMVEGASNSSTKDFLTHDQPLSMISQSFESIRNFTNFQFVMDHK